MDTPPAAPPLHRRPGVWLCLVAATWAVSVLVFVSDGALSIYSDMLAIYVGAAVVATALLVTLVLGTRRAPAPRRRRWPPLAFAMLVLATMPSLCRYNLPFSLRLRLSERALAAAAQSDVAGGRWIGWFRVADVERTSGVARFTTGSCGFAERCGIAFSLAGAPPYDESISYKAIRGPFWAFERRASPTR